MHGENNGFYMYMWFVAREIYYCGHLSLFPCYTCNSYRKQFLLLAKIEFMKRLHSVSTSSVLGEAGGGVVDSSWIEAGESSADTGTDHSPIVQLLRFISPTGSAIDSLEMAILVRCFNRQFYIGFDPKPNQTSTMVCQSPHSRCLPAATLSPTYTRAHTHFTTSPGL